MQAGGTETWETSVGGRALLDAYLAKRGDLIRFFTRRTGSFAAAEDIVQELYLKLPTMPVADVRSPEALLYRIGSNIMLDRVKQMRRQTSREENWGRLWAGDGVESVADVAPADDVVAAKQRLARLLLALDDLPAQTAQAFRLHKFEGLSHPEVAERLGVYRSKVEKCVMAAMRRLLESERST